MRPALFLVTIGLGGAAILLSLGIWQVQRLAEKEDVIAQINSRIADDPVALPADPDPDSDAYLPVVITGMYAGDTLRVLVSQKDIGAGYRLITAMDSDAGRVLIDRGFVAVDDKGIATPDVSVTVQGNLQWPQETDIFTPEPDPDNNVWFARDVPLIAEALNTRPILIVASAVSQDDPVVRPFPVDTSRIPNNHLQYAITWFSLAAIWIAMSFYFFRRINAPRSES